MVDCGASYEYMATAVATISSVGLQKIKRREVKKTNPRNAKGVEALYRHLLISAGLDEVTIESVIYASHRNDQEFKEFLAENVTGPIDFGDYEKVTEAPSEMTEPRKSFYRPLQVGETYTVLLPRGAGGWQQQGVNQITGKVIDETQRFYLIETERGIKTTVLKNDLCLKATKIKKAAQL